MSEKSLPYAIGRGALFFNGENIPQEETECGCF